MLFYGKIPPPSAQVGGGEVRVSALCGDVAAGIRIAKPRNPLHFDIIPATMVACRPWLVAFQPLL